jgi:hypothetical protein
MALGLIPNIHPSPHGMQPIAQLFSGCIFPGVGVVQWPACQPHKLGKGIIFSYHLMMPLKDPEARRAYHREYLKRRLDKDPAYKAAHLSRVRKNDAEYRKNVRDMISRFKSSGCLVCGELEPVCLCAHHLNPDTKDFSLGNAARWKMGSKRVALELEKCVCLCHNCHAKVHAAIVKIACPVETR